MTPPLVALAASLAGGVGGDLPYIFPQSDVAVVYVTGAPGVRQTLRVSASTGLERVDAPGGGLTIITDTLHGTTTLLDNTAHTFSVVAAPPGTADMRGRRAPADYRRTGQATVASAPCTEWTTHDPAGRPMTVCLTDDGVLIRASTGGNIVIEAASIEHAVQDPSLFAPPASWRRITR